MKRSIACQCLLATGLVIGEEVYPSPHTTTHVDDLPEHLKPGVAQPKPKLGCSDVLTIYHFNDVHHSLNREHVARFATMLESAKNGGNPLKVELRGNPKNSSTPIVVLSSGVFAPATPNGQATTNAEGITTVLSQLPIDVVCCISGMFPTPVVISVCRVLTNIRYPQQLPHRAYLSPVRAAFCLSQTSLLRSTFLRILLSRRRCLRPQDQSRRVPRRRAGTSFSPARF